ncbi:MAG TPA: helicase-exonuclease AddAB subunit AddA, partial [Lachnospiraceae bacterium]|nr:helicase-exonuclease AddAB subunit AddA [Lachnospiraceae bacterium]
MAIQFTEKQTRVLEARDHNILVSAAAGSGKTAVLVERIVRMISEGERPLDIDRLLVVTFTRAAAAQMRERIARAVSDRLREDPSNAHLRRQETLIHNAQITTIDSFCSYLLRNNFSEIDLDPDFRVMDQTESELMSADVLDSFLEECYQQADPAFLECAAYFCPGSDDRGLQKMIADLYTMSSSRPQPEFWLKQRREDYHVESKEEIFTSLWLQTGILQTLEQLEDMDRQYSDMLEICGEPDGPEGYAALLTLEQDSLFGKLRQEPVLSIRQGHSGSLLQLAGSLDAEQAKAVWDLISGLGGASFGRLPALGKKRYPNVSESKKNRVKDRRAAIKTKIASICGKYSESSADLVFHTMRAADGPLRELVDLTLAYAERYRQAKREKNLLDFPDLEHYALQVLLDFHEDGTCTPRPAAMEYRRHFAEILIDEYQDSNDVQELLLRTISTEDEGRNNRFMVGDVKQSIYKFRLARPEIFMEKFDTYRPLDPRTERIDLDQNFRSRSQVLDSVN